MMESILQMINVCKSFGSGVIANDNASFSVVKGEIHALAGENGAGKTTLMKIMFGMEKAQKGDLFLYGEKVVITSPVVAMKHGIGMVHQHFMLIDDLTVAENVVLGIEPKKHGLIDREQAKQMILAMAKKYDMPINPDALIRDLPVVAKQKVEILKVLARQANIIILDEPTAVLTPQETNQFFRQLILLKDSGKTIIIITHKLKEIKAVCDRITIMRSGKTIGTYLVSAITEAEISRKMVGIDLTNLASPEPAKVGDPVLDIQNISELDERGNSVLSGISFQICEGEILGVIGVEGNGQRELVEVLTGRSRHYTGNVSVDSQNLRKLSIRQIRNLGVAYISEDRMSDGVDLNGSVLENVTSVVYAKKTFNNGFFQNRTKLRDFTLKRIDSYSIKCDSLNDHVKHLSGGNMQKVICAREIDAADRLLIADQPTRGVDVGSVLTIHEKMIALKEQGKAILLISSDLSELYRLCQRAIVVYQGEIVARIDDLSKCLEVELGLYMLGLKRQLPIRFQGGVAI